MFIPLRTDRPPRRTPLVTQGLVVVNLAVYLIGAAGTYLGVFDNLQAVIDFGRFDPKDFKAWQLITYQFMHEPPHSFWGMAHIAFNMVFLWVFGSAVEDRLGRLGFLGFYLTGGIVAALVHAVFNPLSPVIGASGAVTGVTGAFLALFPRSRIRVLVFFFIIAVVSIPSLWFIGFFIVVDVLQQLGDLMGRGGSNVAYMAHIAGYLYGFGIGFALLATGILKREEFDVFFLFTQARRRAAFRAASRQGPAGMWSSATADTAKRLEKQAARARPANAGEKRLADLRAQVNRLLAAGDLKGAATLYRQLLAPTPTPAPAPGSPAAKTGTASSGTSPSKNPEAVLGEQAQLNIASQLFADDAHAEAACAYELLLDSYPSTAKADEVRLMLGLIYARHLQEPQRARELLERARPHLRQTSHTKLADELLAELGT